MISKLHFATTAMRPVNKAQGERTSTVEPEINRFTIDETNRINSLLDTLTGEMSRLYHVSPRFDVNAQTQRYSFSADGKNYTLYKVADTYKKPHFVELTGPTGNKLTLVFEEDGNQCVTFARKGKLDARLMNRLTCVTQKADAYFIALEKALIKAAPVMSDDGSQRDQLVL